MKRLCDIGENALIERLVSLLGDKRDGSLLVGPGDDCAVVDVGRGDLRQLFKTDAVVQGRHYLADTPAQKVGWKAVARVVSDFAAMGGSPEQLLITIAMPAEMEVEYVENLYRGMQHCVESYGATICGGETTSLPQGAPPLISVAATGWVKHPVLRSGGSVGDVVLVTGDLGGSFSSGKHLDFKPRLAEGQWLASEGYASAMMDLSDGLAQDLPRLARASGCGFKVDFDQIPRTEGCDLDAALGDGEDYELLLTVPASQVDALKLAWLDNFPDLKLSEIGVLTENVGSEGVSLVGGWQHFESL